VGARRQGGAALHLLRTVVPRQRWGVAQVRPDGWRLYFKGGWGSGRGLVDHQVALLRGLDVRLVLTRTKMTAPRRRMG
jgi:hypothetical protein